MKIYVVTADFPSNDVRTFERYKDARDYVKKAIAFMEGDGVEVGEYHSCDCITDDDIERDFYRRLTGEGHMLDWWSVEKGDEEWVFTITACELVEEPKEPIWMAEDDTPELPDALVYFSKNGKMGVIKERKEQGADWERTWDFYTKKYNIIAWAYQTDLFPNRFWPKLYLDNKEEE